MNTYAWSDRDIPKRAHLVRYRLKQTDFDGSAHYSYVVSVELNATLPVSCALEQNYPNPVNRVTTISYTLPNTTHVILQLTDARGIEIAKIENGVVQAGTHVRAFDASALPCGVYFYHLIADGQRVTKKMTVLK